uniref:RNA-directed DNA polymerase n=1 Tax=Haemonchus contortus TaxID=6289 RepID=A0A7I5E927_HAECO
MAHTVKQMPNIEIKREIVRILDNNERLFQDDSGKCSTARAEFKFKNDVVVPKFFRAWPIPVALRPKVEAKLEEMVLKGIIRRVEHSKWATPLVVVPKPDGKMRIHGDYKVTVNPQLDINQYPLSKLDDLFHMLHGGKKFPKVDYSDAYMQVELEESSRMYTTFNTHKGLFEYTRIPFGIASPPAIFQRITEHTLAGIEGVLIYLDDITVTGSNDKTHLERLVKVLNRLNEVGFRLKRGKCDFFEEEMEFLGLVVDEKGIGPSSSKLKAILNMPEPMNIKKLESYLGMIQYYGKFIPRLATLAAPLNSLRRKGAPWRLGAEEREALTKSVKSLQQQTH